MSMHIEGPWLSTSGKAKSKQKFRNAGEAQKAREQEAEWKELQKRWGVEAEQKRKSRALNSDVYRPAPASHRGSSTPKLPSIDTGWVACTAAPPKVYTGTKVKGIGTMHKSNAVPIFSDEEAKAISSMRR